MKLFTKYNRINFFATIVVLLLTAFAYYRAISYILNNQVDKDIKIEEKEIFDFIKLNRRLPAAVDFKDQHTAIYPVRQVVERRFVDTTMLNHKENEYEAARGLITPVTLNGNAYAAVIIESKVETEDLISIIFKITIGIILFLLLVLFVINRFVLNRMWQPFYDILYQLKAFRLTDNSEIPNAKHHIDEFSELNKAVVAMAQQVKTDYKELKTFTENASHELLTPIAVINSKLDSLIQTGDFSENQSNLIADVYGAISRLTRINQSLLLLVKIENRLVNDDQLIDVKALVEEKTAQFNELFLDKKIEVILNLQLKQIQISRYLAEILLNNLLGNALRHNHAGGMIRIFLNDECLRIENTGAAMALKPEEIFKRFSRSANSEGTGLGLTISKQICDSYGFELIYSYAPNLHAFMVKFTG